jgi:hypothetical protein
MRRSQRGKGYIFSGRDFIPGEFASICSIIVLRRKKTCSSASLIG